MADHWPASLPQCFIVGFESGLGDGRIANTPDTGPDIIRGRSSAMPDPLSGQMRMTRSQIETLKTFWKTTLIKGSLPFTFKDPTTGETVLVRFPKDFKLGWQQVTGGIFRVGLQLEILP